MNFSKFNSTPENVHITIIFIPTSFLFYSIVRVHCECGLCACACRRCHELQQFEAVIGFFVTQFVVHCECDAVATRVLTSDKLFETHIACAARMQSYTGELAIR